MGTEASFAGIAIPGSPTADWIRAILSGRSGARIPGIIIEDLGLLQSHAFSIQLPEKPGIIRTF